jgi:hypothetical protein
MASLVAAWQSREPLWTAKSSGGRAGGRQSGVCLFCLVRGVRSCVGLSGELCGGHQSRASPYYDAGFGSSVCHVDYVVVKKKGKRSNEGLSCFSLFEARRQTVRLGQERLPADIIGQYRNRSPAFKPLLLVSIAFCSCDKTFRDTTPHSHSRLPRALTALGESLMLPRQQRSVRLSGRVSLVQIPTSSLLTQGGLGPRTQIDPLETGKCRGCCRAPNAPSLVVDVGLLFFCLLCSRKNYSLQCVHRAFLAHPGRHLPLTALCSFLFLRHLVNRSCLRGVYPPCCPAQSGQPSPPSSPSTATLQRIPYGVCRTVINIASHPMAHSLFASAVFRSAPCFLFCTCAIL